MDAPELLDVRRVTDAIEVIPSLYPIPGLGMLAVNAFLIRGPQPVLIDTGVPALRDGFVEAVASRVDLKDLRWLWLTHAHADHMGSLAAILAAAPNVRLVTTYMGMGLLGLHQLPIDRVFLLNPGQALDVGDRKLRCVRPPTFDSPETTAIFDEKTGAFFPADSFGALLQAPAETAEAIEATALVDGMVTWATIDAPWLSMARPDVVDRLLAAVGDLDPSVVLGSHLPPARGMTGTLLDNLRKASGAAPFVGPDQAALERMMAG